MTPTSANFVADETGGLQLDAVVAATVGAACRRPLLSVPSSPPLSVLWVLSIPKPIDADRLASCAAAGVKPIPGGYGIPGAIPYLRKIVPGVAGTALPLANGDDAGGAPQFSPVLLRFEVAERISIGCCAGNATGLPPSAMDMVTVRRSDGFATSLCWPLASGVKPGAFSGVLQVRLIGSNVDKLKLALPVM